MMGSTTLGTGFSSIHPLLLSSPWLSPPQVPCEDQEQSLSLYLHPCAQPLQHPGKPPRSATLPAWWLARSCCPCLALLPEIKA